MHIQFRNWVHVSKAMNRAVKPAIMRTNNTFGACFAVQISELGVLGENEFSCDMVAIARCSFRAVDASDGNNTLRQYHCRQNGNAVHEICGSRWPVITVNSSLCLLITVHGSRWPIIKVDSSRWSVLTFNGSRCLVITVGLNRQNY